MATNDATSASTARHDDVWHRTKEHPADVLRSVARQQGLDLDDVKFARHMDSLDPVRHLRQEFHYPLMEELYNTDKSLVEGREECVYLCGNSLGLLPRCTPALVNRELDKWAKVGVEGHTKGVMPWALCDEVIDEDMAALVGARKGEVAIMNGLTINLHLQMISFYRPTQSRHKILCEEKAFPSDHYAFESQIRLHGFDPSESLICMRPRKNETTLRTEDILDLIEREGPSIALVCLPGVQYYTGQLLDIPAITAAGLAQGCYVGWDLAHAAGNVELFLHDWGVDFACWCTYKYMNSGAGCLAGFFLHEKHANNDFPKLTGWWGHKMSSRFDMTNEMDLDAGAYGYRVSNPPGLLTASIEGYLQVMKMTSMAELRRKSRLLTGYLELLIDQAYGPGKNDDVTIEIFTPRDPEQRGAQLSLCFSRDIHDIFRQLQMRGVVCDKRLPRVIRVAPVPLYCSFEDVHRFLRLLALVFKTSP